MTDVNENLVKLWNKRAEIFEESAVLADDELKDDFMCTAITYRICAKELLNPPTEIFERMNDE